MSRTAPLANLSDAHELRASLGSAHRWSPTLARTGESVSGSPARDRGVRGSHLTARVIHRACQRYASVPETEQFALATRASGSVVCPLPWFRSLSRAALLETRVLSSDGQGTLGRPPGWSLREQLVDSICI